MKILTGFAIINDRNGERISYAFDEVDTQGNLTSSNNRKSYIALDESTKAKIADLRALIEARMNTD